MTLISLTCPIYSPNTYARFTGSLKSFAGRRYINCMDIRPIEDPHGIFFHITDVVATHLKDERREREENEHAETLQRKEEEREQAEMDSEIEDLMKFEDNSVPTELLHWILRFIEKQPDHPDGVSLETIVFASDADVATVRYVTTNVIPFSATFFKTVTLLKFF
jgi:replication factor A2